MLSITAHGLLWWRNHNQNWLRIEAWMRQPATKLATFLAKGTCVAENVGCKVTCSLTLFALPFIFHKASAASAWSIKCFTTSLLVSKNHTWKVHQKACSRYMSSSHILSGFGTISSHDQNRQSMLSNAGGLQAPQGVKIIEAAKQPQFLWRKTNNPMINTC